MKISSIDFDSMEIATERCITFAKDNSTVVKPYKKLYSVATITNNQEHSKLFLEVVQRTSYKEYKVWEQLTDFCISIGSIQEDATVEELI